MTTPRIYTYKITFEEVPYWYWGVHKEKKFGELYLGSPVTHKWMWEFYTPKIQILEFFPNTSEGWEDAKEVEHRLILPDLNNPLCLNEHCGKAPSLEACSKGGQKANQDKNEEGKSVLGVKNGNRAKENQEGIFNPDYIANGGRELHGHVMGTQSYLQGRGIFNPDYKESKKHLEMCVRNGYQTLENKTGIHCPELRSSEGYKDALKRGGLIRGNLHAEMLTGVCNPEVRARGIARSREVLSKPLVIISPLGQEMLFQSKQEAKRILGIAPSTLAGAIKKKAPLEKGPWKGYSARLA
jgi:hypothetical protein